MSGKRVKVVHRDKDAGNFCNQRLGVHLPRAYPYSFFNRFGWAPWQSSEWLPFLMPDAQGVQT